MRKTLQSLLLISLLAGSIPFAKADTPQFDFGFSVQLIDQDSYLTLQKTNQPKGRYFALLQPAMPDRVISFENLEELIHFYSTQPNSVKKNGLWVRLNDVFSVRPSAIDLKNIDDLKKAAAQNNVLLFLCLPQEKSGSRFGFAWECSKENPVGNSTKIVCEGRPKNSVGYWICDEKKL